MDGPPCSGWPVTGSLYHVRVYVRILEASSWLTTETVSNGWPPGSSRKLGAGLGGGAGRGPSVGVIASEP